MRAKKKPAVIDREVMTETERELLTRDLTRVAGEYFELDGRAHIDITRTDGGFSICALMDAKRIKKLRRPQP